MELLIQLLINGIISSSLYALLAIGFGVVYRSLSFFHIAYGGIYLISSYTGIFLSQNFEIPLWIYIPVGIIVTILVSFLIEKVVYIPFEKKGAGGGILLVTSLGVFIIIQNLIAMYFGNDIKVLNFPLNGSLNVGPFIITKLQLIQFFTGITFIFLFWVLTKKNIFFKALWAIGDNPTLIKVLGYPYYRMRLVIFAISGLFVSLASFLTTFDVGIDPYVGMRALLIGAVAVIIGGINSFPGWISGAFLIGIVESLSVWKFSSNWSDLFIYGILILILLFRPEGIFHQKNRKI